jgi:CheY-like chemotaxis protein
MRVIHVDDEPDIREVVEVSLSLDPDIVLRSCGSGEEALLLSVDWTPDVILLDVMMPGMDGPATLAELRANQRTSNIPVVFMTARAQSRELDLFRSLGAAGVIPKPFDPMTLAGKVRSYPGMRHDDVHVLKHRFLHRVRNDSALLERYRTAIENASVPPGTLTSIRDIAHGLAGAGGIYGFPEISETAAVLEEVASAMLEKPPSIDMVIQAIDHLLACLRSASRRPNINSLVINGPA